jgi:RNA polymerase sigma factor (sigma-70 family)
MPHIPENSSKIATASTVVIGNPMPSAEKSPDSRSLETFISQAVEDYESTLIGYASTILHDTDLARDVVQDTFIRLCKQDIAKVRDNLKSWLFTVCRNRALDLLRKDKRSEPMEEIRWKKVAGPGLQPDEQASYRENSAQLMGFMNRLTDKQREVIILKFQQGLSYQEIRSITGLTTGNIGFLIHTGLKRLREIIPDDLRL